MKAITLTQPWATLVAIGAKRIETRSWSTAYRGPLAIHAAKKMPREAQDLCLRDPFKAALHYAGCDPWGLHGPSMKRGLILATCQLVSCLTTEQVLAAQDHILSPDELAFGDYSPGRFAWFFADIVALDNPAPAKGALGLWDWNEPAAGFR